MLAPRSRGRAFTHVGRRDRNEDAYVCAPELGLYAVADGIGGMPGGDVASAVAIGAFHTFFRTIPALDHLDGRQARSILGAAVARARDAVRERARGPLRDMGTTLSALWVGTRSATVAHIGDTRIYRVRAGGIERLTLDHSVGGLSELLGIAEPPQGLGRALTRALSHTCDPTPELHSFPLRAKDLFVLCSDGVSEPLGDDGLREVLGRTSTAEAARALVEEALRRGGTDNATAVVVGVRRRLASSLVAVV